MEFIVQPIHHQLENVPVGARVICDDDGLLHCDDGPAISHPNGHEEWWNHGKRHRIGGPAMYRFFPPPFHKPGDWHSEWWKNGKKHRLDGPAVESYTGEKVWFVEGNLLCTFKPQLKKDKLRIHEYGDKAIEKVKWFLIRGNPEQILFLKTTSLEQQEYVIQHRPDFIEQIPNLKAELKAKYQHETEMAGVDL